MTSYISKNSVLKCSCGCGFEPKNSALWFLESLSREYHVKFNKDLIVTSGARCFAHNKELAAMSTSLDKRVAAIEVAAPLREQLLQQQISCCCNSANAAISALQQTVQGITKTVIPITAVCPQPMPEHNSWTAPTTTASSAA